MTYLMVGFFAYAQSVPVVGSDIQVTAQVLGCGDGVITSSLGEQCEGLSATTYDFGGETCSSLGYDGGSLGCRINSCVFDTRNCTNNRARSATSSGSRGVANSSSSIPSTSLTFSGKSYPGAWVVVVANGEYLTSVQVDAGGDFFTGVSDPEEEMTDFEFYAISSEFGISAGVAFSTEVAAGMTTNIRNIILGYLQQEQVLVEDTEVLLSDSLTEPLDFGTIETSPSLGGVEVTPLFESGEVDFDSQIIQDILGDSEIELDPGTEEYLFDLTPENSSVFGFTERLVVDASKWYPNVYVSFMTPYWLISYELLDLFQVENTPWISQFFSK